MSFNFKDITEQDQINNPILSYIRKIDASKDNPLLVSLLDDYDSLNEYSFNYQKVVCTVVASILLQRRVYFCLTYRLLNNIVKKDLNLSESIRQGVSLRDSALIFNKLINTYKIFELVQAGNKNTKSAAIYKVSHPEILSYLESIVDSKSQLDQCISFNNRK